MTAISLDRQAKSIRQFLRSLPVEDGGAVLAWHGKPLLRGLPISEMPVAHTLLKAGILSRRRASRRLNQAWAVVDRETWDGIPDSPE